MLFKHTSLGLRTEEKSDTTVYCLPIELVILSQTGPWGHQLETSVGPEEA